MKLKYQTITRLIKLFLIHQQNNLREITSYVFLYIGILIYSTSGCTYLLGIAQTGTSRLVPLKKVMQKGEGYYVNPGTPIACSWQGYKQPCKELL